jgi:L-methionine (R)-S-oxide reductase
MAVDGTGAGSYPRGIGETNMALETLAADVDTVLAGEGPATATLQTALEAIAKGFEARTATLHVADVDERRLHMVAYRGIPEHIVAITREIPFGKGMAGICAERAAAVTVCNVQTDATGTSRAGAKETGVAGAIVVPVTSKSGALVGTLGIGKTEEHEYSDGEQQTLEACAARLAPALAGLRRDR